MHYGVVAGLVLFGATLPRQGLSTVAMGELHLSPEIRIAVLQIADSRASPEHADILVIGVRKRISIVTDNPQVRDTEVRQLNPANCATLTALNGNSTTEPSDRFDVRLNAAGRTADERRQLENAILAAFATSREVRLYVSGSGCSSAGARLLEGIRVLN